MDNELESQLGSFEEKDSLADALQSSDDQQSYQSSQQIQQKHQTQQEAEEPEFKGPQLEFRKDQLNIPKHDRKVIIDSEVLFSPNETEKSLIKKAGDDIFYANKLDRERKMDQFINQVRWRFAGKDQDLIQSNSRLVEWEDGSYGLYIGKEYYEVRPSEFDEDRQRKVIDRTNLYVSENNVMVNQGGIAGHGQVQSKSNYTGQIKLY